MIKSYFGVFLGLTTMVLSAQESVESLRQKIGDREPVTMIEAIEINPRYVVNSVSMEKQYLCFRITKGCDKVWYKTRQKTIFRVAEKYTPAADVTVSINGVQHDTNSNGVVYFTAKELGIQLYPPKKHIANLVIKGADSENTVQVEFHSLGNAEYAGLYAIAANEKYAYQPRWEALQQLKNFSFFTEEQYQLFLQKLVQNQALKLEQGDEFIALPEKRAAQSSGSIANTQLSGADEMLIFDLPNGVTLDMIPCPAGSFMMGSPRNESGRDSDEVSHRVTLTQPFWIGKFEITQAQYQAVIGTNPSKFRGNDCPVENVSWNDADMFCKKMNILTEGKRPEGYVFALPTEAQWEYACRAGTITPYAGDLDSMGWYDSNAAKKTHPVGSKNANSWGIYDMHGNVWEWCRDWETSYTGDVTDPIGAESGSQRMYRGGGWPYKAGSCRAANRRHANPRSLFNYLGFRIALVPVK